ncbi:glutamic acid-rich protein-like [Scylla paramamosain]|uniref:glutamic acid-rich protein-like n=1 Tax=Scylla paramamosain TaxID=85552 RepID=UPI0030839C70
MPGFSTEDFGALLNNTRFNKKNKKQQSMDAHETLGEKNTEKMKQTKHHSKRRSLENLQDCTGHKKTNTEGVMEPKKQRNNLKTKTRMRMEYLYPIIDPNKKRKKQDMEGDENQNKKTKKDTEDHEKQYKNTKKDTDDYEKQDRKTKKGTEDHKNQDKKRKKDTKDHEKQEEKSKDKEDHENQHKNTKGEGRKNRRKGWNMECCKRIKDCIKKWNKKDNEDYEEQAKKSSTEKRESQAKKRKGKSIEDHDSQAKKRKGQGKEDHDTQVTKKLHDKEEHDNQAKKRKRQDKEEDDTQAKKVKRQDKEKHDTQAKKVKRQDKEEHETQAKKGKGEEKEPKKRRPLENYKRILDHLRKRGGRDSSNVLKLKVEAERVKKKRSVSEYCRVHLEEGHMTDATVRGHPCLVFFDTGASASIMFLSLAKRAGLLTGREKTEKILFSTWNGILLLDVIMLDEVLLVLKDGLAVNTPMLVFPKEAEITSRNDVIVLSMSRLQEAEMRQDFHHDGSSTLFLRHPERLRRRPQPGREGKVFAFAAQAQGVEEPLMVLLDTCSTIPFSITKIGRYNVRCRTGSETALPTRVILQFGSGTLTVQMNTNQGVSDFDFVFGRPLLCKLRAAIDYVDSTMTLKLNRKQFCLDIFPH